MWNMLKVNNKDTRSHWRRSGIFIVNFEHISHLARVFCICFWSLVAGVFKGSVRFNTQKILRKSLYLKPNSNLCNNENWDSLDGQDFRRNVKAEKDSLLSQRAWTYLKMDFWTAFYAFFFTSSGEILCLSYHTVLGILNWNY